MRCMMIIENDSQRQQLIDYLMRAYYIDKIVLKEDSTQWYTVSINTFNKTTMEEWILEQDPTMWVQHDANSEENPFSFTVAYALHEHLYTLFVMKFPV